MFSRKSFLIFLLLASPASLMAQESILPVVYDATENAQGTQITINGTGFGTKQPKVSLGTAQLTVTAHSNVSITANIPSATPAGAYLLDVQNENSRLFTLFTATIGQIGPAGPAGPAGPPGPCRRTWRPWRDRPCRTCRACRRSWRPWRDRTCRTCRACRRNWRPW